jgi:hypothetical protein
MIGLEKKNPPGFSSETPRRSPNLAFKGQQTISWLLSLSPPRKPPGAVIVIRHIKPNLYFKELFRGEPRTFQKVCGTFPRYHR